VVGVRELAQPGGIATQALAQRARNVTCLLFE
jgi:hypothetical protein